MHPALLDPKESRIGILICGHGSRYETAVKEFSILAKKIKLRLPGIPVEYGYLEFARPIIPEALDRLRAKSVSKVIAIPAMLFAAGHTKNDIPALLNSYSKKTGLVIEYGRELGLNSLMIGAAGGRVKEAIEASSFHPHSETLLVVVGRGSSDPDANSNVSKITRMLVEGLGMGWGETVYSGVTFPLVEPGLRHAVKLGFKRIIVFPYFLFSGVLINRIFNATNKIANENPNIEFIKASYLSSHKMVIDTFLERIDEVINGNNLMNCALCKYRSDLLGFENEVGIVQESHHHHVEGINPRHEFCDKELSSCGCDVDPTRKILKSNDSEHSHEKTHPQYPNFDHPLGPVTLRS